MKLRISKEDGRFMVNDPELPGSPYVGRGRTMLEAIGGFFHAHQTRLGIDFEVDDTAVPAEMRRRRRELRRR
jgi:hypothetical protein